MRRLTLLLVLGMSGTATAWGDDGPYAIQGAGAALTCSRYVQIIEAKDQNSQLLAEMIIPWVQGYFSGRNTSLGADHLLHVGGTISSDTLKDMLADQCKQGEGMNHSLYASIYALYDKLQKKGI